MTCLRVSPVPCAHCIVVTYHRLRHANLLGQSIAAHWLALIEKVSNKGAHSAGVGSRPKGKKEERKIESCVTECVLVNGPLYQHGK